MFPKLSRQAGRRQMTFYCKDCEGRNGREVDSEREQCTVRDCDPVDGAWTAWSRDLVAPLRGFAILMSYNIWLRCR